MQGDFRILDVEQPFYRALQAIAHVRTRTAFPDSPYWLLMASAFRKARRFERGGPRKAQGVHVLHDISGRFARKTNIQWVIVAPALLLKHALERVVGAEAAAASVYSKRSGQHGLEGDRELWLAMEGARCDRCHACGRSSRVHALKRCSTCKLARYCDGECQRWHWTKGHKQECQVQGDFKVGNYVRFQSPDNKLDMSTGELLRYDHVSESWRLAWVDVAVGSERAEGAKARFVNSGLQGAVRDSYCLAVERMGGLVSVAK